MDPFAAAVRGLDEPDPARAFLRAAGPLVRLDAPAGGPAWIVTDEALARAVLVHPDISKDPAWAPTGWDPRVAGLEPPAAAHPSLTTLDGPDHVALRRAHAPLFSAKRLRARYGRMTDVARELLDAAAGDEPVDLTVDLAYRYPLVVLLDLLGVPLDRVDDAIAACRGMLAGPAEAGRAMAVFLDVAAAGLGDGDRSGAGLAAELRDRVPPEITRDQLLYLLFGLIFPGQITTGPALGFVLARLLDGRGPIDDPDDLIRETLRRHPPASFTLWRFTTAEVELAGERLPPRSPVLVDILGIDTDPQRTGGPDLTFGAGPHHCVGLHLAALELLALAEVVRTEFPDARLAVPYADLRQVSFGGAGGTALAALPVVLGSRSGGTAAARDPSVAV